jgi:hypothetical protein
MEKPRKFHNVPVERDGLKFASGLEAERWFELVLMEKAGEIRELRRQVVYRFEVEGVYIGRYTADHVYTISATGEEVVEDAKGFRPRGWAKQKKLMLACYGLQVKEWPERERRKRRQQQSKR